MKKISIFLFIFMVISLAPILINKTQSVNADGNYKIHISTSASYTSDTNLAEYNFCAGYKDNEQIIFIADLYYGDTKVDADILTFSWTDASSTSDTPISTTQYLTLNKTYESTTTNLIMVGVKNYIITVAGSGVPANCKATLKVDITDNVNHEIILTQLSRALETNSKGAYKINKKTSSFSINAVLSKSKVDCTINWYLKTPNSSTFDLYKENGNCTITPNELVNSTNGFGTYKIYASAQSSSILYTSKIIYLEATAGEPKTTNLKNYTISKKVVNNSKSELEAFTFTLENASEDGLDFDKIYWYINGEKMGKGEQFFYEPTTNDTFKVSVQYQGLSLIPFPNELEVTPHTTGTIKMVLYISGAVLLLSIIFAISVKTLNKKRDVVW